MKKILFLFVLFSFSYGFSQETPEEVTATSIVKLNQKAPEFSFQTADGKTVSLADYKGKVILINFFATWCGPCMKEMPYLQKEVWDKLKDNPDFALLSFGRDHSQEEIDKFIAKKKYTFPIFADKGKLVYNHFASMYIPRNYVIDRNGTVVYTSFGFTTEEFDKMKQVLADLLK
ncbi:MAG: TlpA family protein disulfide reductase [Flavobacterium sp.]